MSVKFLIEDNKIIFEGHAKTEEFCHTITAMCDALAASEDFETIKYESGYAEFNRVSGGDSSLFLEGIKTCECKLDEYLKSAEAKGIYLSQTDAASIYATKTLLNDAINEVKSTLGSVDPATQGSIAQQISTLTTTVENLRSEFERAIEALAENDNMLNQELIAFKNKISKPLPFTADELIAKLESI